MIRRRTSHTPEVPQVATGSELLKPHTFPAVARVSLATLRAVEDALAPGLTANERELRREGLRETIADLIDAARWRSEPL